MIALFGDKRPLTGAPGPKAGRLVVQLDLTSGAMIPLAMPPLHRPIALATSPDAAQLYVLDFGAYEIDRTGRMIPQTAKGTLWGMSSLGLREQLQTALEAAE